MAAVSFYSGILLAAALLLSPAAWASTFAERLAAADKARSSDPARFLALLTELERDRAAASVREQRHLRLLRNYRRVIAGEYGPALGDAIPLFDEATEPDLRYRTALLVANTAAITRDFTLGLRYLERALEMRGEVSDPQTVSAGYGVAAVLYNQFAQYELGKEYADLWLANATDGRSTCVARHLQIEAMHGMGRTLDDAADIQSAISHCAQQREPIASNLLRSILAQRWAKAGKTAQAIAVLEASLPEAQATGYTRLIGELRSLLARYRYEMGDMVAAEGHAAYVAAIDGQDPHWQPNVTARHVLYRIALERGNYAAALNHYRAYAEADKARLDDLKAREYAVQLSRHELSRKNQSIQALTSQNQVLLLQQEVARRSAWNFRMAIALLLVITASAAYWGWRARRTHRSLHQLANTDGLTGLSNRRHFRACSEAVLAQCAQQRRPVSVLLFDLDHFKQINDQCGHSSGDWVLREVAGVVRRHCREGDLFGRIGGEEYAMTLPGCEVDAAMRIAEQARMSIEAIHAGEVGCALPVAASIGVVGTSTSGYEYETLIAHADAAMYRSKVAGRNRVTAYQPPLHPEHGHHAVLDSRNAGAMLKEY